MDASYLVFVRLAALVEWLASIERMRRRERPGEFALLLRQTGRMIARLEVFIGDRDVEGAAKYLLDYMPAIESSAGQMSAFRRARFEKQVEQTRRSRFGDVRLDQRELLIERVVEIGQWIIPFAAASEDGLANDANRSERRWHENLRDERTLERSVEQDDGTLRSRTNPEGAIAAEKFFFALEGEAARGSVITAGSEASLTFRFDVPPPDALATVDSERLEQARRADVDISLCVTPREGLAVVGDRRKVAEFRSGRMTADVVFRISAAPDAPPESSLHVDFSVAGESVHQLELHVAVVRTADALTRAAHLMTPVQEVALAVVNAVKAVALLPDQRLHMTLSFDGGRLRVDLADWRGPELEFTRSFVSRDIDRAKLGTLLPALQTELESIYVSDVWLNYVGESAARPQETKALQRTVNRIAVAGSVLHQKLCLDGEIKEALQYIEENGKLGATLTVSTDDIFLPWEFLYPRFRSTNMTPQQERDSPLDPELFWGAKFAIETVQRGTGSLGELRRAHIEAAPAVSLNLNPFIVIKGASPDAQPVAVQRACAERLRVLGRLAGLHEDCEGIRGVLQDASEEATVIYVYCHGASPSPFGGQDEKLQLVEERCPLQPVDLAQGPQYKGAPIVILNSCLSGAFSPLTFSNFLSGFRRRGALGLIATTCSVPIAFAARFGIELMERCLDRRGSLAMSLRELRREHLLKRGNPVPLFYALMCQMNFGRVHV